MNLEIKEAGTARKIATVSFDANEVSEKENHACREISRVANIPGFRKGKAPTSIIRKKFSKELKDELNRKISTEAYEAVLAEKNLRVYSILKVDAGDLSVGNPANVEVTIDIEPEFELPEFEKFELTTSPIDVSEDDVESELKSLCDQRASFDVVERKAKESDYVKCSYEGKVGDDLIAELVPDKPMYGKQSNTWEEAGQVKGLGVDAIAQGVIGMAKDDKTVVEAKFEDDFEVAPLAGKSASYSLEVHEVREKKAPKPDSKEFLESLKVEKLEDLKDKIKKDLETRKGHENENSKRQQVTQKILEMPDFPLPQQAVEDESKNIFQNNVQRALQGGTKQEQIEEKRDELWKQSQTQAEARVKLTLTLGKVAEQEKVEVSNEDLAQAATREAMMMRKDPSEYVKALSQDRVRLNRFRQDILHDKALELVVAKGIEKVCEIDEEHTD
ncbi:MAG: trigger factor [Opitutales bacterium]|nr:trigger factor [Opitutales bacterium]